MLIVSGLPNGLQLLPFTEVYAVTVVPLRVSFTQYGSVTDIDAGLLATPPVVDR